MDFYVWFSFVLIAAANIMTPGPAILNTVRRAAQLGLRRVLPTILGNTLGLSVAGAFCAGGVATFVLASDLLWMLFRWLGVAYLAWLGLKLIITHDEIELDNSTLVNVRTSKLFTEAFLLAVTNPKAILFFVALFPQMMDPNRAILPQAVILITTFCVISIASLSTYSTLASFLRNRFITQASYRKFRIISGAVLIGFAGKLAREAR
mgnify:FL=1